MFKVVVLAICCVCHDLKINLFVLFCFRMILK